MQNWLISNIITFLIAFFLTGMMIPQIIRIAFRKRLFDSQDERKIHDGIVPRLGGIAFVPAILCSVLFVIGIIRYLSLFEIETLLGADFLPLIFLICSLMLLFLLGIADDLIGVRYRIKFLFQFLAAILTVWSGIYITNLCGIFGIYELSPWVGRVLTVFLIVFIINAINLIDGIDGLAAGLAAIALTFFGIVLFMSEEYIFALLAWGALGSLLPFLYYNIFGSVERKRKIFMGDTGSLTIGMLLAFEALIVCRINPSREGLDGTNPIIIGFIPLIVPCFDVARVIYHRIKRHRSPFLPDRAHIHHKFLDLGYSSGRVLLSILTISIFFILSNLWLSRYVDINLLLLLDIIIWTLGQILITKGIRRREKKLGENLYD